MTETLFDRHAARRRRYELGLSVAQTAETANITRWALYKYEAGTAQPPPDVLLRLAAALRTSTDDLLTVPTTGDAA